MSRAPLDFEFFNSYLASRHEDLFREKMPRFLENSGASLWIRRR
jgi:hypothetical protein